MHQSDLFLPAVDPDIEALHQATGLYTRDPVVEQILDLAGWPYLEGKLLDPGAGDGVFLERAIARLQIARDDVNALAARVEGWEIHPIAALAARERIACHLLARGWNTCTAREAAQRVVIEADFLAPGPIGQVFRIVSGNPPYRRYARLPERFKKLYATTVPDIARQDILHAFLYRSAELVGKSGRIAVITSDRWLFNETSGKLREAIGERFGLVSVERLDAESSFHSPKIRKKNTPPRVHAVAVLLETGGGRPITRAPIYPSGPLLMPEGCVTLETVATVRLAPWLGPHGIFTLDLGHAEHLPPELLYPCVDTDDVQNGVLQAPRRVAIRTERKVRPARSVLTHLDDTLGQMPKSARRNPRWAPPETWGPLPFREDALLIPRIAPALTTIRLPGGLLPINHNLTVVSSTLGVQRLEEMLNGDETRAWVRACAAPIDNGYLSITTTLIRNLPIRLA